MMSQASGRHGDSAGRGRGGGHTYLGGWGVGRGKVDGRSVDRMHKTQTVLCCHGCREQTRINEAPIRAFGFSFFFFVLLTFSRDKVVPKEVIPLG